MLGGRAVRTRNESQTKLAEYLGPGKALLGNDLPTLRAILRQGLLFQEEKQHLSDKKMELYPVCLLVTDMSKALTNQWLKANGSFSSSVVISQQGIKQKLKKAWEMVQKIVWKQKLKESQIKEFESKLDR